MFVLQTIKEEDEDGGKSSSSVVTASDLESFRERGSTKGSSSPQLITKKKTTDAAEPSFAPHSISEAIRKSAATSSQGSISEAISADHKSSTTTIISENISTKQGEGNHSGSGSSQRSISEASSLSKQQHNSKSSANSVNTAISKEEEEPVTSIAEEDDFDASHVSSLSKDLKKLKYMAGKK